MTDRPTDHATNYLGNLRANGWAVAVHNDYRLNGVAHTFYLFTHPSGIWVKGEGLTDTEALIEAWHGVQDWKSSRMPLKAAQNALNLFESCVTTMVSEEYAAGYREACRHIINAVTKEENDD